MKANKLTKVLIAAGLVCSAQSYAATEDFDIGFETIVDVSIGLTQAMDFGSELNLASGTTCTMLVAAATHPDALDAKLASTTTSLLTASTTFQDLSSGCTTTGSEKGTAGVYTITGAPGVDVTITVNAITAGTDFNFVPTVTVVDYDGTGDDDIFTDLTGTTDKTGVVTLANAVDVSGRTTGGLPESGQTKVYVGGTITTLVKLTADDDYDEDFTIEVTY